MRNQDIDHGTANPALVTGATGKQGGAVVRALLNRGIPVRALMRDLTAPKAQVLSALGVALAQGDLNDAQTLRMACAGARAVFSVQMPDLNNPLSNLEKVQAANLVNAAKQEGVPHFVQTTSSGTEQRSSAPGWNEGRWHRTHMGHYWDSKAEIEEIVREARFTSWTIIRPAFFMENFIRPSFLFANWTEDSLLTAIKPDTRISMVSVEDIGEAGAAAIADPVKFNRIELDLAGDCLSMRQIANVLSGAMGIHLSAPELTVDEAIARGMMPVLVVGQEWMNEVPTPALPESARSLGLTPADFRTWAHKSLAAAV